MLRSSAVSGHLSNLRRHQAVRARAEQIRRSVLGAATSPTEYVDLLRRKYEKISVSDDRRGEKETVQVERREQIHYFAEKQEERVICDIK